MRVSTTVRTTSLTTDGGWDVDGVVATCWRCGHTTESFGTHTASIRRCLVLLREECPRREQNFYVESAGVAS